MVIITGTSKGIGKAVTENYLALGQKVIGIGRTKTIEHPNYQHLFVDLSKQKDVIALIQLFLRMNGEDLVDDGDIIVSQ
jgi:NAD(P)-dependent dehydrogenase (short-subunit alcohol dehydrogenase family)